MSFGHQIDQTSFGEMDPRFDNCWPAEAKVAKTCSSNSIRECVKYRVRGLMRPTQKKATIDGLQQLESMA